ncbi:hypothetical protein [Acidocella aminolytica]|nr:hypothetical protein [Acidocella aminolytica]
MSGSIQRGVREMRLGTGGALGVAEVAADADDRVAAVLGFGRTCQRL